MKINKKKLWIGLGGIVGLGGLISIPIVSGVMQEQPEVIALKQFRNAIDNKQWKDAKELLTIAFDSEGEYNEYILPLDNFMDVDTEMDKLFPMEEYTEQGETHTISTIYKVWETKGDK